MKRFLIKHVGNMGDMIFFIPPILETLKKNNPGCHITFVTTWGFKEKRRSILFPFKKTSYWGNRNQSGFCINLIMTNPHIDQLVHWDDKRLSLEKNICIEEGQRFPTWNKKYFEKQKKSGEYDNVYELDFGIGHNDNPIQKMYEAIGLPQETYSNYKIYFTEQDKKVAEHVMRNAPKPRIVLIEGLEGKTTRNWDPNKVSDLENKIKDKYNVSPIWFGGKYIPEFKGRPLTLRENIATLTYCDVGIGVISGPLHFAVAAELPTITLSCDQSLHRVAPAFFLNKYQRDPLKQHRTILGPDNEKITLLKSEKASIELTPAEKKKQNYKSWHNPGKQSNKSCLAKITADEIMLVLQDLLPIK